MKNISFVHCQHDFKLELLGLLDLNVFSAFPIVVGRQKRSLLVNINVSLFCLDNIDAAYLSAYPTKGETNQTFSLFLEWQARKKLTCDFCKYFVLLCFQNIGATCFPASPTYQVVSEKQIRHFLSKTRRKAVNQEHKGSQ